MVKVYLKVLQVWFYWRQKCCCHRYNSKNNNNNKCLLLLGWMLWKSLSSGSKNCASSLSQIVDDDKTWEREKKNIRQLDYFLFTFFDQKKTYNCLFNFRYFLPTISFFCVKLKHKSGIISKKSFLRQNNFIFIFELWIVYIEVYVLKIELNH